MAGPDADDALEQSRAAESVASPLKVGERENGENQTDPEDLAEAKGASSTAVRTQEEAREGAVGGPGGGEGANKFYCYICNITCHNQQHQNFQSHMNGLAHQQRMMEIQHMSNACLVTLLPKVQESLQSSRRDGEKRPGLQRWCATCQTHFTSNVLEHRRTKEHKLCTRSSSPCCTVCKLQFRTSREFVEHMQTPEHQQRVQELREGQVEGLGDLSALDDKGCLMGEEEAEEGEDDVEDESNGQGVSEVTLEDMADDEEFDSDTIYGVPAFWFRWQGSSADSAASSTSLSRWHGIHTASRYCTFRTSRSTETCVSRRTRPRPAHQRWTAARMRPVSDPPGTRAPTPSILHLRNQNQTPSWTRHP
ncbi:hypothetical protein AALO_G00165560 [Alosa alosa]|uniref:U1-type domain-containing protein n=1 Tax=Alosa alosa TaxID=278164 RepID=A0AAV6GBE2_9TELE|nr:hypothetical protein AALO_G00165560 [Alosa alosa]